MEALGRIPVGGEDDGAGPQPAAQGGEKMPPVFLFLTRYR